MKDARPCHVVYVTDARYRPYAAVSAASATWSCSRTLVGSPDPGAFNVGPNAERSWMREHGLTFGRKTICAGVMLMNLKAMRTENRGCPGNIRDGISDVLKRHGRAIIIEDDVIVSRHFLTFMDEALERYRQHEKIWCVQGWRSAIVRVPKLYPADVYLTPRFMCWGWGTWRDRWDAVDFDMKNWPAFKCKRANIVRLDEVGVEVKEMLDAQFAGSLHTWDVQCVLHMFEKGLWSVEPRLALTKNIGFGTECEHCHRRDIMMETAKYYDFKPRLPDALTPNRAIYAQYRHAQHYTKMSTRLWRAFLRILVQL